ncbi:MAG: hypothetical protein IJG87_04305 [Ruminococcus sp.]|nr:hypothetical protein [Ruminococcus sp.]
MKKTSILAFALILCIALTAFSFVSCSDSDVSKAGVVGIWTADDSSEQFIFREDGTGAYRDTIVNREFTYTVKDSSITINCPEVFSDSDIFTIKDDILTYQNADTETVFTYQRINSSQ